MLGESTKSVYIGERKSLEICRTTSRIDRLQNQLFLKYMIYKVN